MKTLLAVLALTGTLAVPSATAETFAVKGRIPFDFVVAGTELSAGVYTIESQGAIGALMIRDSVDRVLAIFPVIPMHSKEGHQEPILVFNRYGDRHFLSNVWPAVGSGGQLLRSKLEKELVAAGPPDKVLLLAKSR